MLLYLHIPFCDSKCHYCAFNSYTTGHERKRAYMQALLLQLRHDVAEACLERESIETLFVGGGTPSTVEAALYAPVFAFLAPYLQPDAEITFEANPNSATQAWLEGIRELGANRVSFGVQSFDDAKLKFLGRAHTAADALRAVSDAKAAGFSHISVDLIYSTPFDDDAFLDREFATLRTLRVDHLSLYSLTIEEATKFAATPEAKEERDEVYETIAARCEALGLPQYEVANFGSYRSRHNMGYWRYQPYLGIGAGAVGRTGNRRTYPHKSIDAYLADPLFKEIETLSSEEIKTEKILLGLRFAEGFDTALLTPQELARAQELHREGKVCIANGRLLNPNLFLADEIALYIT